LDFGLVRELSAQDCVDEALTLEGSIVGTPMYLAPEAIRSDEADARSDIYALGAVGYFMLTGRPVFEGRNLIEVCSHHLYTPVSPPSLRLDGSVPEDLEALLLQCLAKDPEARPQSALAFAEALADLDVPPWTSSDAREWQHQHAAP